MVGKPAQITKERVERRRRRRPEEAEGEILEAAEQLLRELPSHTVTVAEIMARTSLSRKSFYVYFRDRHDLITRLVSPLRAELDEVMERWSTRSRSDPRSEGRAALLAIAKIYMRHGPLLRALAEASRLDRDARRAWREFTDPPIAMITERIREDIARGLIRQLDAEATARALVGMNLYSFFDQLVDNPEADPEPLVDALHEIWMCTLYDTSAPNAAEEQRTSTHGV
jgi:TetR/AcrR family transcriptional regulator, ethionamide resistance regulator